MNRLVKQRLRDDIISGLRLFWKNIKTIALFCILLILVTYILDRLHGLVQHYMGGTFVLYNYDSYILNKFGLEKSMFLDLMFPKDLLNLVLLLVKEYIIVLVMLYGMVLVATGSLRRLRKQNFTLRLVRESIRTQAGGLIRLWLLLYTIMRLPIYILCAVSLMGFEAFGYKWSIPLNISLLLYYAITAASIIFQYVLPFILCHKIDNVKKAVTQALSILQRSFVRYCLLCLCIFMSMQAVFLILTLFDKLMGYVYYTTNLRMGFNDLIKCIFSFLTLTTLTALYHRLLSHEKTDPIVQVSGSAPCETICEPITEKLPKEIADIFHTHIAPSLPFDEVGDFSCGLARVKKSGFASRWGYVNAEGLLVLPCNYQNADDFNDNIAVVKTRRGERFIDKTGQAMTPEYDYAEGFSEGLALVRIRTSWAFLHPEGQLHKLPYDEVFGFREGLAAVRYDGRWLYIDKAWNVKLETDYEEAWSFRGGLALVMRDGQYGFIDHNGVERVPPQYFDANSFSEGLAAVAVRQSDETLRWGYIDTGGQEVISPRYNEALPFQEGRAAVCEGQFYGHIDSYGNYITPLKYESVGSFRQGYAVVKSGGCGYVDRNGTACTEPVYLEARPFREGLAWVRTADGWGVLGLPER